MNISTQLAQFQSAEAAAAQARQQIIDRLDASAQIVRSVRYKRFRGAKLPAALEWTAVYNKPGAQIVMTGSETHPVEILFECKTYKVAAVFFGSTWDIAKETRKLHYKARYRTLMVERDEYAYKVNNVDAILEKEIAKIRREAERKIAELQRSHGGDLKTNQAELASRERQIERCLKWAREQDERAAKKAAKKADQNEDASAA